MIPKMVYRYRASPNHTMHGFVDWSLSTFNVADFDSDSRPINATASGLPVQPTCRYPGYHSPTAPYNRNFNYWLILSARLSFVLAFVIFVLSVSWVVSYVIPDVPKSLDLKMKRENFLAAEADKEHRKTSGKSPVKRANPRSTIRKR